MWGIRTPFQTSPPRRKTQVSCVSVAPWVAHNAFDKLKFLARGTSSPIPYHLANEQKKTRFWQSRSSHSLLCCWLWCMCVGGGGVGWGGSTQGMGSKLVGGCGTPVGGLTSVLAWFMCKVRGGKRRTKALVRPEISCHETMAANDPVFCCGCATETFCIHWIKQSKRNSREKQIQGRFFARVTIS